MRTRTSAAELVRGGRVRVNGRPVDAPGHPLKIGDVLTVALDSRICVRRVQAFVERRGDAAAARVLYADLDTP